MKLKRGDIVILVWLVGLVWTIGWKATLVSIPLLWISWQWCMLGLRGMGLFGDDDVS